MNLEHYLYQYLLKHRKAEVPDFGVFELTKESAKIDAENSIIIPPKEIVNFQYKSVDSDLLANYLADEIKTDLVTAQKNLKSEVEKWFQTLKSEHNLKLENIGQFQFDDQNNIIKISEDSDDVYGLEAINIKALKNPVSSKNSVSEDYSFNKNVIWTFVGLIIIGSAALFLFGDRQLIFGKSSQIPSKKIVKKDEPKKVLVIPKQDSTRQDSLKQTTNAKIQKVSR